VFGGCAVGVAHAEVDDVFAEAAGGDLHLAGDVEDIGREALNTAELFHLTSLRHGAVLGGGKGVGGCEYCGQSALRRGYAESGKGQIEGYGKNVATGRQASCHLLFERERRPFYIWMQEEAMPT
jgi:hypothetical protein